MKNIEVTYDALICENGTYEQGEAAFILPMTDELAAEYLAGRATDRGAVNLVETALEAVEVSPGWGLGAQRPRMADKPPGRTWPQPQRKRAARQSRTSPPPRACSLSSQRN